MSMSLESLGIDRLSLAEKIELAHDLWESIAADAELSPLTNEQKQMLIAESPNSTPIPRSR